MDSATHWVEEVFPARYSIGDYRATFNENSDQRVRRFIQTLSSFDGPTLAAIYEQSYLFSLIQRLAREEEQGKQKNQQCQTQPVDSVLDIRLIRSFLEKHKEKQEKIDFKSEEIWSSDEISIIRSAHIKVRDDCLRLKSENEYFRQELEKVKNELEEKTKSFEELRQEHFSLKKVHARWTLRTTSAEQTLNHERKENEQLREHLKKLNEQNEEFRRTSLELRSRLAEKQLEVEQFEQKIDHYDKTLKNDFQRRMDLMEKRVQVDKDRFDIEKSELKLKLDKEQELKKKSLLALDQLRKHFSSVKNCEQIESSCDIKLVKYV